MIRREMIQELRNESYDLLENADPELFEPRDPDQPDALERWQSMRPKPQPRQPSTTATVQASWESFIDTRADAAVRAHFLKGGPLGEAYRQAIAEALVIECERYKRALTIEIEALRRELAAARAEIASLRGDGNKICSWSIDARKYRATPFMPDGKCGCTLDLYPLFARYREEVGD